ncbi:MAG: CvpA family protein [Thermomicrobia bacterium]|nr:CvpA family protein [Thermomicrobia bacterium]MCA1724785.1 CvpA family protein [Thermomicrobia bacterium]
MTALALTGLLAILWVAFIAFGYRHGGWRQIILLAAMLLSYAVLSEWAAPNGHDLAAQFHWNVARTTTGVALLYLLVGTFVLGFLGSFALYRPRPLGPWEQALGAAIGLLNGGLLLALILRTLRSYAFVAGRGQTLHRSPLSRFLIEDVGYLLLTALLLGGIAAIAGLLAARRDDAYEQTLLASVATPAVAAAIAPPHQEQPAAPASPAPLSVHQPAQPSPPAPIYATAPLIDWPANSPPGTRAAPLATAAQPNAAASKRVTDTEMDPRRAPLPLPARPQVPPRALPPLIYPVADLIAAQAKPAMRAGDSPPSSPAQSMIPARPVGPPPGATHPAFGPPTATPPSSSAAETVPPIVRELDPPTQGAPSVVRELDVSTHDVPLVSIVDNDAASASEEAREETLPDRVGETMHRETTTPPDMPPTPSAMIGTAVIPTTVPPPLPAMPATRRPLTPAPPGAADRPAPTDETAKARAGYARVAVARQASARPNDVPPEPLHPPLPTGPRVHACPTCGYPVRDHARYCPNCGRRQGR